MKPGGGEEEVGPVHTGSRVCSVWVGEESLQTAHGLAFW